MFPDCIMVSFKKFMSDYGIGVIITLLLIAFTVSTLSEYITSKSLGGSEGNDNMSSGAGAGASAYSDGASGQSPGSPGGGGGGPVSENSFSSGDDFAPVGASTQGAAASITNPSDLLPADTHNAFSDMAPSVQGGNNSNLLTAAQHIGSPSNSAPLRNSNLSLRSEPANPRGDTGPWSQSTIEADPYNRGICD
jgi:hypothetical protein